jgi:4-deoxy-L-threo-5-hexosulose-uronate ketol-isomerase
MEIRFQNSPKETRGMSTGELRAAFLCENLVRADDITYIYSHYDRMIVGGVKPVKKTVALKNYPELRSEYFLERREIGIINVGGEGKITADGTEYSLNKLECLYAGKGVQDVSFQSVNESDPAIFFLLSAPAHHAYPTTKYTKAQAAPVDLGSPNTSNERTIYKYIHGDGIKSCQLVMGLTVLKEGSVWNSVPPHTHTRRAEVYFYFDLAQDQRIFHMMGEPQETRHLIMKNHEAVISAPWGVHFGCGTSNYAFIWAMAGENQQFTDMDPAPVYELK